jgi:hypothetical protein
MDEGPLPVSSPRSSRLAKKFREKNYRDSYVASHTRRFLANQMRAFRGDRSQTEFGDALDMRQTVVSRLENPNYGRWNLQTLFDVARKMDVAVFVRFVDFPTFLRLSKDMSESAARPAEYDEGAIDDLARKDRIDARESDLMEAAFGARNDPQKPGALAQATREIPPQDPHPDLPLGNDPHLPNEREEDDTNLRRRTG